MMQLSRYNYGRSANHMVSVVKALHMALYCQQSITIAQLPLLRDKMGSALILNNPPACITGFKNTTNCPCLDTRTDSAFYFKLSLKNCTLSTHYRRKVEMMANKFRGLTDTGIFGKQCIPEKRIVVYFRAGDTSKGYLIKNNTWKPGSRPHPAYGPSSLSQYVKCLKALSNASKLFAVRILREDNSNPVSDAFISIAKEMGFNVDYSNQSYFNTIHILSCAQYVCTPAASSIKTLFYNKKFNKRVITVPKYHKIWINSMAQRLELLQN